MPAEQCFRSKLKVPSSLFRLRKKGKMSQKTCPIKVFSSPPWNSSAEKTVSRSPLDIETLKLRTGLEGNGKRKHKPQMPYHEWDLQQWRQFILIINWSSGVHNSSLVTKNTVASYQHLICYRLSENLNLQYICQDLFCLLQIERENKALSKTVS